MKHSPSDRRKVAGSRTAQNARGMCVGRAARIRTAFFADDRFHVTLPDGGMFSFPIAGNWRLEGATPEQLNNVEVDDEGLHWPDIDEDLSFAGLLLGDHGQYVKRRRYA